MHEGESKLGVPVEHVLDEDGVGEGDAEAGAARIVGNPWRTGTGVQRHRDVQLLGEREVGLVPRITECRAGVNRGDFAEDARRPS